MQRQRQRCYTAASPPHRYLQPSECAEIEQVEVVQHSSRCLTAMNKQDIPGDGSSTGAAGTWPGTTMECLCVRVGESVGR